MHGALTVLIILALVAVIVPRSPLTSNARGDVWTQTTQADFDSGTKMNVDTMSDIGNVTLSHVWNKAPHSYVLNVGTSGAWDDTWVHSPMVVYNGGIYRMWYSGIGANTKIGYATSPNGIAWTKYASNPVLSIGSPGSWDEDDVSHCRILFDGITYRMWFTGEQGGNLRIGYATSSDGLVWTKYAGNPVLNLGIPGSWDDERIYSPMVLYIGTTYHMWYSGGDGVNSRIGYATSPDGIVWTKYGSNPVLGLGFSGSWDDSHAYTPSIIFDGSIYHMWYGGSDGTYYRIGYATSLDGVVWIKSAMNPLVDHGPLGSWDYMSTDHPWILYDGSEYHMWFKGSDSGGTQRIGYATSSDGIDWTKMPTSQVLDVGPPGSWDSGHVDCTHVSYEGTTYRMWYTGHDFATGKSRIGYATSSDGITWTKYGGNPVVDLGTSGSWDDVYVACPSVVFDGVIYRMWFTGSDAVTGKVGYATSPDGIAWTKYGGNPVLDLGPPGSWDDQFAYYPEVNSNGTTFDMWYTGYDGSNGRIGHASSADGISWTKSPANPVLDFGPPGSWEETGIGSPMVLRVGSTYRMWYVGGNSSSDQKIGYATSTDGLSWNKYEGNPVLDFGPSGSWDDSAALYPSVVFDGSKYDMWYTGRDGGTRKIGYAIMSYEPLGNFTSAVFDSGFNGTTWISINWMEYLPSGTNITMATRSGDTPIPDTSWSPWSAEMWNEAGSTVASPRSRYIQFRATLSTILQNITPILSEVNTDYSLNTALPPTLMQPPDDIWISDNTPTFQWTFNDNEGDSQSGFTVQIDDDSSFASVDYTSGDVNSGSSSWTSSSPITDGIWYWRLRTEDIFQIWSIYSNYKVLKIDTTPPIIADITEIPNPQEVFGGVNISANVTDNIQLYGAWIEIHDPLGALVGNFSMAYDTTSGRFFRNQSYAVLGTFTFTLSANDTVGHWTSVSESFVIHDTTPPLIQDVAAIPDPQEVFDTVNVSANVTDNYQLSRVWLIVHDPEGDIIGNFSMSYDTSNARYFWIQSYDILGAHTFSIWANDTSNNLGSASGGFEIEDTTPPLITGLSENPDPQTSGGFVNVTAKVTDNVEVEEVWISIDWVGNYSMTLDPASGLHFHNASYLQNNTYTYTIWAKDTSGNWAQKDGTFIVQPKEVAVEFNWKPIIALTFAIILALLGLLVSVKKPIRFTGIIHRDRSYTFLGAVLPFIIAEIATGLISLFTGLLSVPPLIGWGMAVDLAILMAGLLACILIFAKGTSKEGKTVQEPEAQEQSPIPSDASKDAPPEGQKDQSS